MAKFLTIHGVSYEIENIMKSAKSCLVLISPYVKIPETLLQSLKDADRQKVKITLVYGKKELEPEARSQLQQLDNLSLYFLGNLHAKCFFNEENMVITSLNLLDSSRENREMGVLINAKDDAGIFTDANREVQLIINSSMKIDLTTAKTVNYPQRQTTDSHAQRPKGEGYCIKCKASIPLNTERPFCRNCYSEWSEWGNPYHEENCCHLCGKSEPTTIDKPLCYSCYKRLFG